MKKLISSLLTVSMLLSMLLFSASASDINGFEAFEREESDVAGTILRDIQTDRAAELDSGEVFSASGLSNFKKEKTYNNDFVDVPSDQWYYQNVKMAFEYGVVNGEAPNLYVPGHNITIAETITIAARLHKKYNTGVSDFTATSIWYQTYVDYALTEKIISGTYTDYNRAATRLEFASIMANAFPASELTAKNTVENNAIPDVPFSSQNADKIYTMYRAGILGGNDPSGTFEPNSNIVRSEVAAIISRMIDPSLRIGITLRVPTQVEMAQILYDVAHLADIGADAYNYCNDNMKLIQQLVNQSKNSGVKDPRLDELDEDTTDHLITSAAAFLAVEKYLAEYNFGELNKIKNANKDLNYAFAAFMKEWEVVDNFDDLIECYTRHNSILIAAEKEFTKEYDALLSKLS